MTAPAWFYFVVAALLYVVVYYAVEYALRPKPREGHDWFWGPDSDGWVRTEQNDRQESKPTSGAG
jgi:hypothetical protein